ncbi:hypothetical protein HC031_25825 [Planosporangium thailandense]|uniref:Uncharacterized protein n=1 Tax=Planosporangium thailandense TaxID=765197 RepID=A0ABX0Y3Y5_9ACTN|nr:hypothetical protein [Planosporangium thailandense]NJC73110.1 hypothetical protein [Planosporangium thailandense]
MASGKDLIGNWLINGNGSPGTMTIFAAADNGPVELEVSFDDVNRKDLWTGTWSPGAREIVLNRQLPGDVTQTYTGHLGDNHPPELIFGGAFTQSDVGALEFGWFAVYRGIKID